MPYFPNSLELERRLRALGAMPELLDHAFVQLERWKLRFRDEIYLLMSEEQVDKADLALTLAHATATPTAELVFMSNAQCKSTKRDEQYRIYEVARRASIRRLLETRAYWSFAYAKDDEDKRRMIDVIKGAIGTRRLTLALDNTFGNSFASLFKHDIVAVWTTYFMAFAPKTPEGQPADVKIYDDRKIQAFGKLIDFLTQALPTIRLPEHPNNWIVFTA